MLLMFASFYKQPAGYSRLSVIARSQCHYFSLSRPLVVNLSPLDRHTLKCLRALTRTHTHTHARTDRFVAPRPVLGVRLPLWLMYDSSSAIYFPRMRRSGQHGPVRNTSTHTHSKYVHTCFLTLRRIHTVSLSTGAPFSNFTYHMLHQAPVVTAVNNVPNHQPVCRSTALKRNYP